VPSETYKYVRGDNLVRDIQDHPQGEFMIGAAIGLIGFATILGALGMFLMSLNQKLLKRYPATRKQAGWMALTGLAALIAGVAFTANNPIPPEPARASSATVAQGQVKPTLTAPKATQQQRPQHQPRQPLNRHLRHKPAI
jgi:hypothetical protein